MISSAVVTALVAAWEFTARAGWLSPLYFPAPTIVLAAYRPQLAEGLAVTLLRTVCAFTLGIALSYFIHYICLLFGLERHLDTQLTAARAVPVIAVLPLFSVWFGFREIGRLLVATLATAGFFMAPLHEAYRLLPRPWRLLQRQLPLGMTRFYATIVMPGTLPQLAGGLRISLAVTFTIAIASEYLGAQRGVGKFLDSARITFNVPGIVLAIIVCSLVGVAMDRIVMWVYRRRVFWAGKHAKQ